MNVLQVDHRVPEEFLRKLLRMYNDVSDPTFAAMAVSVAETLGLDWEQSIEIDVTGASQISSWRERFASYEESDAGDFEGKVYEALQDVDNLWLICPTCNGRGAKSDRLLREDYDRLNSYYNNLMDEVDADAIEAYLGGANGWIGTGWYWEPADAVPNEDFADSSGYSSAEDLSW